MQSTDEKDDYVDINPSLNLTLGRGLSVGKGVKNRMPNWHGKMAYAFSTKTSAAATALGWFEAIQPSNSTEATTLSALYDEVTVHGVKLLFAVQQTVAATLAPSTIVAYDPMDSTAPTSLAQMLVFQQNSGLRKTTAVGSTAGGNYTCPISVNGTGWWDFAARQKGKVTDLVPSASPVYGFGVFTESTASAASWGYLKGYIESAGAGTTSTFGFVVLDVEYRMRS